MLREEATDLLDNLIGMVDDNHESDYDTALNMAIKALEQEPCEDCISRQAVLDEMYKRKADGDAITAGFIKHLQPVTPQPKTGHWIEEDMFDGDIAYRCSECDEPFCLIDGTPTDNMYNFCPNCGAKMESEE